MRFSEDTRYPHPVLSPGTGDFSAGEFDMDFTVHENPKTGSLTLEHSTTLTENGIISLVEEGKASVGCFVKCQDTYYSELLTLTWPEGRTDFEAGKLLNRVSLRPLVWMKCDIPEWDPGTINDEFDPPVALKHGDIIAIGDEHILPVGQAKLAPVESIFELDNSPDIPEGILRIELERDRITILVGEKTYESILLLRGQAQGKSVVMNAVYLPAVMEVLDALRDGGEQYEGLRWYSPFMARCDFRGIDPADEKSLLESAQLLLDSPVQLLSQIVKEDE